MTQAPARVSPEQWGALTALLAQRSGGLELQAVLVDLRRFALVHVPQLLRGTQNVAAGHRDLRAGFVERREWRRFQVLSVNGSTQLAPCASHRSHSRSQ